MGKGQLAGGASTSGPELQKLDQGLQQQRQTVTLFPGPRKTPQGAAVTRRRGIRKGAQPQRGQQPNPKSAKRAREELAAQTDLGQGLQEGTPSAATRSADRPGLRAVHRGKPRNSRPQDSRTGGGATGLDRTARAELSKERASAVKEPRDSTTLNSLPISPCASPRRPQPRPRLLRRERLPGAERQRTAGAAQPKPSKGITANARPKPTAD